MASFLVTSRETLEATLVVGIVLAYLTKTNKHHYRKTVYYGIAFGILASLLSAFIFTIFAGGFEGRAEEIFEGITMLFASFLLTTMILWMMRQKHIARHIESKVSVEIEKAEIDMTYAYGLFLLVLIAVLREGVETVIFLNAMKYASGVNFVGGLLGVLTAIGVGYLFFTSTRKVNLKKFFNISSILLILFAAGLVAQGIHELQEAGVILYGAKELWNINPAVAVEGVYPLLHEKGMVGSFLKGLFGYNGNPSLLEVLSYIAYLGIIFYLYRRIENSQKVKVGS
ncbi:FTR1 family protein [Candidatus Woesearchaeota archaeon]|nr:FTR1 family protein [Candidatus Woesearchaeota archaeon]